MANRFTPGATGFAPATSNGSAGALGIAVVGYGYWGPNLVRNFSESNKYRLAGISDVSGRATFIKQQNGM